VVSEVVSLSDVVVAVSSSAETHIEDEPKVVVVSMESINVVAMNFLINLFFII
jgi:hypothetical protein